MWFGALALAAGGGVGIGVHYANTGHPTDLFVPHVASPVERKASPFKPNAQAKSDAIAVATSFVQTAVKREHVERSYDLVAPPLRQGYTRRGWASGTIPVVPYPVDSARWKYGYAYDNVIGFDVAVFPKHGTKLTPMVFGMELTQYRSGSSTRWLVSSWQPHQNGLGPSGGAGGGMSMNLVGGVPGPTHAKLGASWLLFPLSVLALIVLVPVGLGIREWVRGRRAERRYRETRSS